jgi:hypothetical protein
MDLDMDDVNANNGGSAGGKIHLGFVEPFSTEDLETVHDQTVHPDDFPHKVVYN